MEATQPLLNLVIGCIRHGMEQAGGDLMADDRRRLEKPFGFGIEAVDPCGEDGLHGRWHLHSVERCGQAIPSWSADQGLRLDECADTLFEEERVAFGALDQEPLEPIQRRVVTEQTAEELFSAAEGQWIDPDLGVIRLAGPAVLILGTVAHEQEEAGGRKALDEPVQDRLRLAVDPVEILEDRDDRLNLALAEKEALDCVERLLAPLRRVQARPRLVLDWNIEKREERR